MHPSLHPPREKKHTHIDTEQICYNECSPSPLPPQPEQNEPEDQKGTQRTKEQRWSDQEEPGKDSGFNRYSTTFKPILMQPSEPHRKLFARIHFSLER